MSGPLSRSLASLVGLALSASVLGAQAAVDPSIAPRAARLAEVGERQQATELLGRYLATAPDDGSAWLELGKLYLADSRDWHRAGHQGEPPASLFLDFAATALDQSLRLPTDSGFLLRALVEVDRAAAAVEDEGWRATRASFLPARGVEPPAFVAEMGRNLLNSCPMGGVLVTGSELESVAAWSTALGTPDRGDLVLVLASRFSMDSVYRKQMAAALGVETGPTPRAAFTAVAVKRPVCFSPRIDTAMIPPGPLAAVRLVRVAGPAAPELPDPLSVAELLHALYADPDALTAEALALYREAARSNPLLCSSLIAPLGPRGREGCGR
jgi:tetratricopeptide (TPR) repeat protein